MESSMTLAGTSCVLIQEKDGGYFAEGPGFYVWDEDPEVVLETVRDLDRQRLQSRRFTFSRRPGEGASEVDTRLG